MQANYCIPFGIKVENAMSLLLYVQYCVFTINAHKLHIGVDFFITVQARQMESKYKTVCNYVCSN